MMSSSRVIRNYTMDRDNAVVIEIHDASMYETNDLLDETEFGDEEEAIPPEEQAENIINTAREEAEQIILDAQAAGVAEQEALRLAAKSEIAILQEQAKNDGYQEGITAATREGDEIRAQARQALVQAEADCVAMKEALEPEMVELLINISNKLFNNAIKLNPSVILSLVRMGMQNATLTGNVKVFVSASDFEEVTLRKDELTALTDGSVKLEIIKDMSLNAMDCIIETPYGSIDASFGQQFDALKQNITYLLNG